MRGKEETTLNVSTENKVQIDPKMGFRLSLIISLMKCLFSRFVSQGVKTNYLLVTSKSKFVKGTLDMCVRHLDCRQGFEEMNEPFCFFS